MNSFSILKNARFRVFSHCFALLCTLSPVCFAQQSVSEVGAITEDIRVAQGLLARLAIVTRSTDYSGELTYEHDGILEPLQLSHGVFDGVEYELVRHLNGQDRVFARYGRRVDCASAGSYLLRGGPITAGSRQESLYSFYNFRVLYGDRIAGRAADIVEILPKDNLRFGLILGLDQKTGLLLKVLVTSKGQALERFQFVNLETNPKLSPDDFKPAKASGSLVKHGACPPLDKTAMLIPEGKAVKYAPAWLPSGFIESAQRYTEEDGHIRTFTDGLTSFSVLLKLGASSGLPTQEALSGRRGATFTLVSTLSLDVPVRATVIGEIPEAVARKVLFSIQ